MNGILQARIASLCLGAILLGPLVGCSNEGDAAGTIRPSAEATLVFEGPVRDLSGVSPLAVQRQFLSLGDVGRDGNRIVVPVSVNFEAGTVWHSPPANCSDCTATAASAGGGTSRFLIKSEDGGASFSAPRGHGWPTSMGQYFPGVNVTDKRITMIGWGTEPGVIAATTVEYHTLREGELGGRFDPSYAQSGD
ncbi:MAG: hypothetical protein H0U74_00090 [Bradymonadaceae bacterium]|nr:hypothetical protein [Lujinxingiaceae bacterium]